MEVNMENQFMNREKNTADKELNRRIFSLDFSLDSAYDIMLPSSLAVVINFYFWDYKSASKLFQELLSYA